MEPAAPHRKGFENYWWVPIVGPLIRGFLGICRYDLFVGATLTARTTSEDELLDTPEISRAHGADGNHR
jgi:glycerol uptake facilitator protein